MLASSLLIDNAVREIAEFIGLHRRLENITPGTAQPEGVGDHWGVLKQRVYGTLAYAKNDSVEWAIELNDPAQKAETLDYIRTKRANLIRRLVEAGKMEQAEADALLAKVA